MINIREKLNCCGCSACYNICPQECIKMESDNEGFWYPVVNIDNCSDCGLCDKVCPILNNKITNNNPVAYACINKDDNIRLQSSSGGIFTAIAEKVIADNGMVFGAGFNDDFNVVHSWTDNVEGLSRFRGSKYVQSNIGTAYNEVKDLLKQGRPVLFSGTPCQIAGLKVFLGKEYDGLTCVDIICHGVPSPKVWQLYRLQLENQFQANAQRIAFRRKEQGWKLYSVSVSFDNDTEYSKPFNEDLYMQGFLQNLYLRPSCYACRFKTLKRQSDITLADFWGIQKIMPHFDDDRGISLILINSEKGEKKFFSVIDKVDFKPVDVNHAVLYNPSAVKSAHFNTKRDKFFRNLEVSDNMSQLIATYTKVSIVKSIYNKIKNLFVK